MKYKCSIERWCVARVYYNSTQKFWLECTEKVLHCLSILNIQNKRFYFRTPRRDSGSKIQKWLHESVFYVVLLKLSLTSWCGKAVSAEYYSSGIQSTIGFEKDSESNYWELRCRCCFSLTCLGRYILDFSTFGVHGYWNVVGLKLLSEGRFYVKFMYSLTSDRI